MAWNPKSLPELTGKTIVVTGGARGVGYFVAEQLAPTGATIILAVRSLERGDAAIASILERVPAARLESVELDVASLHSVRAAAEHLVSRGAVDILINNAGKTSGSRLRETTVDGLEVMVGTNHVGPFAFTAGLWPALAEDARIVSLGSLSTRLAKADLDDLLQEKGKYNLSRAYATSKHAVHSFALELDRRLRASDSARRSVLAHPGFALDGLAHTRPGITDTATTGQRVAERALVLAAQGKDRGAWPVVRAAVDPAAQGGEFYGPRGLVKGHPVTQKPVAQSAEAEFGARLWELSELYSGVAFPVGP